MKKLKKYNKSILKFNLIDGIDYYVAYVNHETLWVSPLIDYPDKSLYKGCCFAKIDSKGNIKLL